MGEKPRLQKAAFIKCCFFQLVYCTSVSRAVWKVFVPKISTISLKFSGPLAALPINNEPSLDFTDKAIMEVSGNNYVKREGILNFGGLNFIPVPQNCFPLLEA